MKLKQIADIIQGETQSSHQSILIAIEGFGGSGKTTLAAALANKLGRAYVIHMDDFIVKEKLTEPSWDKGSFDRERLERQVLRPLRDGRAASYQKLIWANNSLSDYVTIPSAKYIIIEGISSYHPDIAHYYDWKIWVVKPSAAAKPGASRSVGGAGIHLSIYYDASNAYS